MRPGTVIRILLAGCAIFAIVALVRGTDEFGITMFVLGCVGFLVLALAALAERRWFRK
jgi:hypothetical protein